MAVHVVIRQIPRDRHASSSPTGQQFHQQLPPNIQFQYTAQQPHIVTQNVIYGQMPFERTQIFREPNNALVYFLVLIYIFSFLRIDFSRELFYDFYYQYFYDSKAILI